MVIIGVKGCTLIGRHTLILPWRLGTDLPGTDTGDDIYYEAFGPATLPKHQKPKAQVSKPERAQQTITVTFSKSGKSLIWNPNAESLLEFIEDNDIEVDSGCRAGSCGSCQTALESGEVDYDQDPDADVETGHCLLCISKPKSDLTLAA